MSTLIEICIKKNTEITLSTNWYPALTSTPRQAGHSDVRIKLPIHSPSPNIRMYRMSISNQPKDKSSAIACDSKLKNYVYSQVAQGPHTELSKSRLVLQQLPKLCDTAVLGVSSRYQFRLPQLRQCLLASRQLGVCLGVGGEMQLAAYMLWMGSSPHT